MPEPDGKGLKPEATGEEKSGKLRGGDEFRNSPELPFGLRKPAQVTRPWFYMTEDEAYQFRKPNTAYNDGAAELSNLPDGLKTDGSAPRRFGDPPVTREDNTETLRHNQKHPGFKSVQGDIEKAAAKKAKRVK